MATANIKPIPSIHGKVPNPHMVVNAIAQAAKSSPSKGILSQRGPVTQTYGQPSQFDVFSHGISPAYEVAVPTGTQISAPPGTWKVVSAYNKANPNGHIGNFDGGGWGNHIRLQNTQTGEVVGVNHLSSVGVNPGDTIQGGAAIGASGMSGNSTGPHVAFTYADAQGKVGDFAKSSYVNSLYGDGGGSTQQAPQQSQVSTPAPQQPQPQTQPYRPIQQAPISPIPQTDITTPTQQPSTQPISTQQPQQSAQGQYQNPKDQYQNPIAKYGGSS